MNLKKTIIYTSFFIIITAAIGLGTTHIYLKEEEKLEENEKAPEKESLITLSEEQIKKLGIDIAEVSPGNLTITLSSRGKLIAHPDGIVHILPKISGMVHEVRKNLGDSVKDAEIIAVLESQQIADLKANYLAALSKEGLSKTTMDRETELYNKKISPEQDFLDAKLTHEKAKINTLLTRQKLYAFGLNAKQINDISLADEESLKFYPICTPLDGVVLSRHVSQGEYVESTDPLYEIGNFDKVWVEMGIYPNDLSKIKIGQDVEVMDTTNQLSSKAKLIYLSPEIEGDTLLVKAIAELDNQDKKWRPGMLVHVEIHLEQIPVSISIPKEAIQTIDGDSCVFVSGKDCFEKKAITLGRSDRNYIEVTSGLDHGQKYVSNQAFILKAEQGKNSIKDDD